VGKLQESLNDPAIPVDVKQLIETCMEQYFGIRNRELAIQEKQGENGRFKFVVKIAIFLVSMILFVVLGILGYLTTALAAALGIGMGAMLNVDLLKKLA
jgi:hypothetical protein